MVSKEVHVSRTEERKLSRSSILRQPFPADGNTGAKETSGR